MNIDLTCATTRLVRIAFVACSFALAACSAGTMGSPDTGNGNGNGDTGGNGDTRPGFDTSAPDTGGPDAGLIDSANGDAAPPDDTGNADDTGLFFDVPQPFMCEGGGHATITGHTFAPNGRDPIPRILVYAIADSTTFPPAPTMVSCTRCVAVPPGSTARGLSGPDGAFSISAPDLDMGGTVTVVMVSGGFRRVIRHVVVPPCGTVMLTAQQTSFAGATSGDDVVPRIAVGGFHPVRSGSGTTTGEVNDHFVTVLDAIGITNGPGGYDTFDPDRVNAMPQTGSPRDLVALLTTPATLNQYQVVVLPCGSLGNFTVAASITAAMRTNLQNWLQAGGRLYASDLAYSFINSPFPAAINWAPGPSSHAGADPADVGVGRTGTMSINATVDDADLMAWLRLVPSTPAVPATGNMIPIFELRDPWGAMDSFGAAGMAVDSHGNPHGKSWVSADVSWHLNGSATMMSAPSHHMLTAQVDYPGSDNSYCGRAVFTSYHVQSATMASALSPQERVLEYLFFQLTTCSLGN